MYKTTLEFGETERCDTCVVSRGDDYALQAYLKHFTSHMICIQPPMPARSCLLCLKEPSPGLGSQRAIVWQLWWSSAENSFLGKGAHSTLALEDELVPLLEVATEAYLLYLSKEEAKPTV